MKQISDTDTEIIKALKELLELMLHEGDLQRTSTISKTIDFINHKDAEIERLQSMNQAKLDTIHDLRKDLEAANSVIEKLKGQIKKMETAGENK